MSDLFINSEIGRLKKIILHKPDFELDRIVPDELSEVLFEDIPWMNQMRKEHDGFADALRENGADVLYLSDLLEDILLNEQAQNELIEVALKEVQAEENVICALREFLISKDNKTLAKYLIAGLGEDEFSIKDKCLNDFLDGTYSYYFKPLPNLYFMRDVGAVIKSGVAYAKMKTHIRSRESMIVRAVYEYTSTLKPDEIYYDNKEEKMSLEGGDILVLSDECVLIGFSQRTSREAIDKISYNLLTKRSGIKKVLAMKIPHVRAFMHLDTVFTMLDYDKFIIFPNILKDIEVVTITVDKMKQLHYNKEDSLNKALENALNIRGINIIKSGGNSKVISAREQWNDSTNTFAVSPGHVITYNRNEITNEILEKNNIKVTAIQGSELVRGRGGPRCMSMPILREKL